MAGFEVITEDGRSCRKAGERQVHAGRDNLGQDQEPRVQSGGAAKFVTFPPP